LLTAVTQIHKVQLLLAVILFLEMQFKFGFDKNDKYQHITAEKPQVVRNILFEKKNNFLAQYVCFV